MKSFFHRRAFTLLEILVILGIIVLFLALLVPFAFRFKEGGRSTVCLQNFRQIIAAGRVDRRTPAWLQASGATFNSTGGLT